MSDDEQSSGGRPLRMGTKKKDGPNWFMIAGGAVVMAVSVAFGRTKILSHGSEKAKERVLGGGDRSQAASHYDDDMGSVHSFETVHNGTLFWENSESAAQSHAEFEFRSVKTKRPAPNDPSPQASKFCRQLSHNSVCQSDKDPGVQSDSHTSAALRAGLTARREMVHRLRQQIRSRDAMIYDMQTQLSDQQQMIRMHRNHAADLQECVQAMSAKLFEANLEVQRLHRELMAQRNQTISDLDEECIDIAVSEMSREWVHTKGVEEIVLEARRLSREVERLEREKEVKDSLAQAKSRQCELLSKTVSSLAAELAEVKTAALSKQSLLEAKEQENLKLGSVHHDLQHKLEITSRDNEWARSSKLIRRTDIRNMNSSWKVKHSVDQPVTPPNYEGVSSPCVEDGHYNCHQTESLSLRRSYASVHGRNESEQQDCEVSVAKAESWCLSDTHTKWSEAPFEQDKEKADEGLIRKFETEVHQVASGLSVTSKVVSEQLQAATQILMKVQERSEYEIDSLSIAKELNFPQIFSSLSEGISAEQIQELREELQQVARQQDVEREIKVLSKHHTKLEKLKHVVRQFSARFYAQNTEGDLSNPEVFHLASSLADLEEKLAVQEEIVKEASSFLQQLSTSFQVPSPQSPPVQEIWRTVKETSGNTTLANEHHNKSVGSSDENSRSFDFSRSARVEENETRVLECQDPPSALPRQYFSPSRNNAERPTSSSPVELLDQPYQFHLGACDGPTSRTQSRALLGAAARIAVGKPATYNETMVGSKRQSGEPLEQSSRSNFRPHSEITSGFSVRLANDYATAPGIYPSKRIAEPSVHQLEAIVKTAQPYEQEQGDRMSSPEPEPRIHIFQTTMSEPSVSNATVSKRFRTQSGCGALNSPAELNFMQSAAAYNNSRCGSPQSPCFVVTRDEASFRRPLFCDPLAASSNLNVDGTGLREPKFALSVTDEEDTDFQIKRSTEENSTRASYYSNADCTPRHLRDAGNSAPVVKVPCRADGVCGRGLKPTRLTGGLFTQL